MPSALKTFRERNAGKNSTDLQQSGPFSHEEITKLFFDLNVHQVELETQNEELRRIQQELEKERAKYANLYEYAPVGYITVNQRGIITNANLACAEMTGRNRSELLLMSAFRLIISEDQPAFFKYYTNITASHKPVSCELMVQRKNGEAFPAFFYSNPLFDNALNEIDLQIAIVDISGTRHTRIERKIPQSENAGV